MSREDTRLLGRWGEAKIADDLRRRGTTVVAANFSCRFGEIDLIAEADPYLVFVEVKLRKSDQFAPARAFVDAKKQARLRITAEYYLATHPTSLQPRFDVAEIYAPQGINTLEPRIYYIENAF
jgi:putative endonuclease